MHAICNVFNGEFYIYFGFCVIPSKVSEGPNIHSPGQPMALATRDPGTFRVG